MKPPIEVIPAGSVKLVNPLQPLNAHPPIEVIPSGSVKLVNPLQLQNAQVPISVILDGSVKLVNPLHEEYPLIVDYQYYILKTVEK